MAYQGCKATLKVGDKELPLVVRDMTLPAANPDVLTAYREEPFLRKKLARTEISLETAMVSELDQLIGVVQSGTLCQLTVTLKEPVREVDKIWIFPSEDFGPEDEAWCRELGIGHEEWAAERITNGQSVVFESVVADRVAPHVVGDLAFLVVDCANVGPIILGE